MYLRQATASQEIFLGTFVDETDGFTAESGLTIANTDIKLGKHGATTLASKNSGGATVISNAVYSAVLDATDTDTLGNLEIFVHVAGARPIHLRFVVLPANVFDSMVLGTDLLQVDSQQLLGTAYATPTVAGVQEVDATHWRGTALPAEDTAGYPKVTVKDGTGTGEIDLTAGGVLVSTLAAAAKADVNAELVDVVRTDTLTLPAQAAPSATPTLAAAVMNLYAADRNKEDNDGSVIKRYADDGTTVTQKASVAAAAGIVTRGEFGAGP